MSQKIDDEISEKVMGWGKWEWRKHCYSLRSEEGYNWSNIEEKDFPIMPHYSQWHPSEFMDHAWNVVEKIRTMSPKVKEEFYVTLFSVKSRGVDINSGWNFLFECENAPLKICKAALHAIKFAENKK